MESRIYRPSEVDSHERLVFPCSWWAASRSNQQHFAMYFIYQHWLHISFDIQIYQPLNKSSHCFNRSGFESGFRAIGKTTAKKTLLRLNVHCNTCFTNARIIILMFPNRDCPLFHQRKKLITRPRGNLVHSTLKTSFSDLSTPVVSYHFSHW